VHTKRANPRTLRVGPLIRGFGWGLVPILALPALVMGSVAVTSVLNHSQSILLDARTARLEMGDIEKSARLYRVVVRREAGNEMAALARVELAGLLEREMDRPVQAARLLEVAHDEHSSHADSASWLMKAAEIASTAERPKWAQTLWERVADTHPAAANKALLALARNHIAQGDQAAAFSAYQRVALEEATMEERSLARIGMSICLERMGDRDAALVELDELGHEDAMWRQRRERLQGRRERATGSIW
jgi:tetratricopeptide (TPR) repeat protein